MKYSKMEKSPRSSLSSLSSEEATAEPEIDDLLEHKARSASTGWSPRLSFALSLSVLLNAALIAALAILLRARHGPSRPPWVPPERVDKHIFLSQPVSGQGPNDTTEDRWAMLMPKGNGWINVTVDDGELPYMPGLDRSLPEQKARLSVFHQLHCLYMARDAFVHARDGHKSDYPLFGTPPISAPQKCLKCLITRTYPSTFNINNIFYTYANNLIFSSELLFDLMGQYTEDEVNQALDAITNGMPIKRAGQVMPLVLPQPICK
ncbi:Oxidase ustYa [Colletotrichum higginsianum]|uniref:Oxidase ustYa n=1 Tax=Colletotrichum higginsianum TaxID=80884 RepID=A0A4T0VS58_9PEZI|nr:Oxidase ustYa [Colletotrichum higginsianum]